MDRTPMTILHQEPAWEWRLDASRAERLEPTPRRRWLLVLDGRAWLTRTGAGPDGEDLWLRAGERAALPAGSEWVVEGGPAARLQLVEERPQPRAARPQRWRAIRRALLSAAAGRPALPA